MKVYQARSHVGAQIGAKVLTSLDDKKDNLEMEWSKEGVFVYDRANSMHPTYKREMGYFIPHGTFCSQMLSLEDVKAEIAKLRGEEVEVKEEKRGPGRPKVS